MTKYNKDKNKRIDSLEKQVKWLSDQVSLLWERVREARHELDDHAKKLIDLHADTDRVALKR